MSTPTIADQLIDSLRQVGVERIYGLVGDSLNPLVDAIRRTEGIEWVHVRNEEAAAFAAAAEAQLTGRLAVCAGSCGPGDTHLIQGLYDANRSGAPVLAIASRIAAKQIGTGFFQETHPTDASPGKIRCRSAWPRCGRRSRAPGHRSGSRRTSPGSGGCPPARNSPHTPRAARSAEPRPPRRTPPPPRCAH